MQGPGLRGGLSSVLGVGRPLVSRREAAVTTEGNGKVQTVDHGKYCTTKPGTPELITFEKN